MDRAFSPCFPPVIHSPLRKMKIQQRSFLPGDSCLDNTSSSVRAKEHPRELHFFFFFLLFFQNIARYSRNNDVSSSQWISKRFSFQYWPFDVHFEDWLSIGNENWFDGTACKGRRRVASDETRERVRGTGRARAGSDDSKGKMIAWASPGSLVLVDWAITAARVVNQVASRLEWRDSTIRVHWKRTRHEVISTNADRTMFPLYTVLSSSSSSSSSSSLLFLVLSLPVWQVKFYRKD